MVRDLVRGLSATYGVRAEVEYTRGVPPVVNESSTVQLFAAAAQATEGEGSVVPAEQSLGGEDFSWYLHGVPGALARLGVGKPGDLVVRDLHQGTFDVDERAIAVGVRVLCAAAMLAL